MEQYTLKDAKDQLEKLLIDAQHGKTVLIVDDEERAVKLLPIAKPSRKPRKAGSAEGLVKMALDFDAPLSDFDEYME